MPEGLSELLERTRDSKMTPEQREEQRRSFAYGNLKIEDPEITRDSIDRAAKELDSENGKT